ncbi:MAG: YkvA family protein [Eubacteriales bacterium]
MKFKDKMRSLKRKTAQVLVALRSKRTPWYAKGMAMLTVAYALSPVDLIPDFIPILGYLDDLLLLPALIWLTVKMIPAPLWKSFEKEASAIVLSKKWYFGLPIVLIWIGLAGGFIGWLIGRFIR